ncbi:mannosyl-glycoprotein endo-beta-N-acetylglucosaminidase [Malassezia yamatoensis]|uniref:Mannosyl-glycoprotein endo-beta-N-acetylglucosaminidase n=1 Tax=Malassezia yamatoensis TaxID=253288 RepID=A0AAJ6CGI6_9BASI|nr:mannosyl-glycoprotein endo-beta-N-acetylglucosaminidase [Malassezia yamatoensis]
MPLGRLRVEDVPQYYTSISALDGIAQDPVHLTGTPKPEGRRERHMSLLVCHDFQGGYPEDAEREGYTFEHWAQIDVFVYFSHHRVSLPPDSYVFAAHRQDSAILGTLIFEWEESKLDLQRLLDGPAPARQHIREPVSFYYADKLIDLAIMRGFDGYLINVEVPLALLAVDNVYLKRSDAMHNALRLRQWIKYLREEGKRRIPEWHVIWYDSITYPHGQLAWQDAMTPLNAPFFRAAGAGFTNYTWTGKDCDWTQPHKVLIESARCADTLRFPHSRIFTGIDFFGRNCFGGHEIWKSLEMIRQVNNSHSRPEMNLSVALFAPAWTWEHDEPGRSSRTWEEWWKEDCELWNAGSRAISKYFPTRAVPFLKHFRTNFATGAGHLWYVRGECVHRCAWTDESVSAPKPTLAWPYVQYMTTPEGKHINTTVDARLRSDAWSGNASLQLSIPSVSEKFCIPLLALNSNHNDEQVIYRLYVRSPKKLELCITSAHLRILPTTSRIEPGGWTCYTAQMLLASGITHLGFAMQPIDAVDIQIGQIDVETAGESQVIEATRKDNDVSWPPFSTSGYEIIALGDSNEWLGTVCGTKATLPGDTDMVEIRRIGAALDESVAYA